MPSMTGTVGAGQADHAVVAVLAAEEDVQLVGLLIVKDHEVSVAEFQGRDGLIRIERTDAKVFRVNDDRLDFFVRVVLKSFGGIDVFVEVPNAALAGAVISEELRLILPHAAGDLADGLVDGGVKVFAGAAALDGDMVRAEQNNFGEVTVL